MEVKSAKSILQIAHHKISVRPSLKKNFEGGGAGRQKRTEKKFRGRRWKLSQAPPH